MNSNFSLPIRTFRILLGLLLAWWGVAVDAGTLGQTTGNSYIAFSATTAQLIRGTPENWGVSNVVAASGHVALYSRGNNSTADSPHSFAQFSLQFRTAGTYRLYYRWRADESRTAGDNATANSSWLGTTFGAYATPGDQSPFYRSDSNNQTAPADNVFAWRKEPTATYVVGAAELAAPVVFTIGSREAGMMFDRIVFSTEDGLTDAQLDSLSYSLSQVVQGIGESGVAFSADGPVTLLKGTPESWVSSNVVNSVGGSALYSAGNNSTADSPHSFAQYQMVFRTAGTYSLYYRWKADESRTAGDNATANSSWMGAGFGAFETPGDQSPFFRTDSNNQTAPADNVFAWRREPTATYTVGPAELAGPVMLTLATREAGMIIDRMVLSTDAGLTDAQLDTLPDSGTKPPAPELASAVGSGSLTDVTVTFTRPLAVATATPVRFSLTPALAIQSVVVDPNDARIVYLVTAAQSQGVRYTLAVSGVTDTSGTPIKAGSSIDFSAWKFVSGWVTRESWLGVTGATLGDIANSTTYPNKPDRVQFVRGFQIPRSGALTDMITRLTAVYTASAAGAVDFFVNNDDEAEVLLGTDTSEGSLSSLGQQVLHAPPFAEGTSVRSPDLISGKRYLLRGVLKQGGGDAYLELAARAASASDPAAETLPILGGAAIGTLINPDLGVVTFDSQPADVAASSGGRARFVVKANTRTTPVYLQWRRNGVDIPGATRPVFTTPVLATGDDGANYDVVVSVAGISTGSRVARLSVTAGESGPLQPYLGVNFVGGGYVSEDSVALASYDVAGVVPQENWNNTGTALGPTPLVGADGKTSPVSLTISTPSGGNASQWSSGARSQGDADGDLMQGFIQFGTGTDPVSFTLDSVPAGTYRLIAYTLGFDFQADYKQAFSVAGAGTYPTYHVQGETGLDYAQSPAFRRMTSTDAAARQRGNYVQFDAVSPAADGTLTFVAQWEGTGGSYYPAVNGFQLVRVVPVTAKPRLGLVAGGASSTLSWDGAAAGFTLESSANVGGAGNWAAVAGVTNPLGGAGSLPVSPAGASRFYRLIKH